MRAPGSQSDMVKTMLLLIVFASSMAAAHNDHGTTSIHVRIWSEMHHQEGQGDRMVQSTNTMAPKPFAYTGLAVIGLLVVAVMLLATINRQQKKQLVMTDELWTPRENDGDEPWTPTTPATPDDSDLVLSLSPSAVHEKEDV